MESTTALAFTIAEAVQFSGLSRSAIYQALRHRELRAKKNGKRTFILGPELERFLAELPDYQPAS